MYYKERNGANRDVEESFVRFVRRGRGAEVLILEKLRGELFLEDLKLALFERRFEKLIFHQTRF